MIFLENICLILEKVVVCLKLVRRSSSICKIQGLLPALPGDILKLDLRIKMMKSLLYTVAQHDQYCMLVPLVWFAESVQLYVPYSVYIGIVLQAKIRQFANPNLYLWFKIGSSRVAVSVRRFRSTGQVHYHNTLGVYNVKSKCYHKRNLVLFFVH